MVELTRSNSHLGSTSFKTRTLCQPRKECGTRKGSFHGEREGKSLQRQLPQWYHPHSSWVKKQKMCCDAKGWATRHPQKKFPRRKRRQITSASTTRHNLLVLPRPESHPV